MHKRRLKSLLLWYALGFLVVQLALAVGMETRWLSIRDPDFELVKEIVTARRAEYPTRPLFVALGSSRTVMALNAARLNHPEDAAAPLVINGALWGAGPMLEQVALRRLVAAGLRPDRVFVEVMPAAYSARKGVPFEERYIVSGRFTADELVSLCPYYARLRHLLLPWCHARLLPVDRRHAELHCALGLEWTSAQGEIVPPRDAYGWSASRETFSPAQVQAHTRKALENLDITLTPIVAPGPVRALRDLVAYCRDRQIAVELVAPSEASVFRDHDPQAEEIQMNVLRRLAQELGVRLTDARCWVDDHGFWDGHHMTIQGANQYTDRFAREVLAPHLSIRPSR
jgi:hypothetical protein